MLRTTWPDLDLDPDLGLNVNLAMDVGRRRTWNPERGTRNEMKVFS
jgi:hypothetical protein